MLNKICLFFLCSILLNNKVYSQTSFRSEIKVVKEETTVNRLTVQVVGYGFIHLTAEKEAMKNLFSSIFFRGIPGSSTPKPLIGVNEELIYSSNKQYFDDFFEKNRYITFVNEKECTKLKGFGSRRKLKCILSVDIQSLKEDLQSNKIIFNYGF